jgi:RNase adaptor protein for sRNA GlmZ degradation
VSTSEGPRVLLTSFGYGHAPPPGARVTIDVRPFRDPHFDPGLRDLTAADEAVMAAVLATPGLPGMISAVVTAVRAGLLAPGAGPVTVAVGCAGGRHRSAAVVIEAACRLIRDGVPVAVAHRDIGRPVIERAAA